MIISPPIIDATAITLLEPCFGLNQLYRSREMALAETGRLACKE